MPRSDVSCRVQRTVATVLCGDAEGLRYPEHELTLVDSHERGYLVDPHEMLYPMNGYVGEIGVRQLGRSCSSRCQHQNFSSQNKRCCPHRLSISAVMPTAADEFCLGTGSFC